MNKYAVIFISLIVVIAANAGPAVENVSTEVETYSKTIEVGDGIQGVTQYDSIFLGNSGRVQCWICSAPCSSGGCCNDGYPQCCLVNGVCRCCRA